MGDSSAAVGRSGSGAAQPVTGSEVPNQAGFDGLRFGRYVGLRVAFGCCSARLARAESSLAQSTAAVPLSLWRRACKGEASGRLRRGPPATLGAPYSVSKRFSSLR